MGIWARLSGFIGSGVDAVGAALDRIGNFLSGGDPVQKRQFAFSIAMIALSAKMAMADGVVTRDEVAAFRRLFEIPSGEERNVSRLFNLARRDVAGYQAYASRIAGLYDGDDPILVDILDGLFAIAKADGLVHEAELGYICEVARLFSVEGQAFERIKARHVMPERGDPYLILGFDRGESFKDLRRRYRRLVAENHPDQLIGRGVPPEFVAIASERLAAINAAWERIEAERRPQLAGPPDRQG